MTRFLFHFINKIVAIRRCPYCKAIIDGGAEYCSNCGTQLLFPEDEYIEEEIPGDKIVEKEEKEDMALKTEEEELEKEEPSPEIEGEEEKEEKEATPPLEEAADIETAEQKKMKKTKEFVKKETQRLWSSVGEEGEMEREEEGPTLEEIISPLDEAREEVPESVEKVLPEERAEEIKTEGEPLPEKEMKEEIGEPPSPKPPDKEEAKESEEKLPPEEEKKKISDTEKKEREEVERFVESIKRERAEIEKEYVVPEEKILPTPEGTREETSEVEEGLPPWAEKIKEVLPPESEKMEEETKREEPLELGEEIQEKEKKVLEEELPPPEKKLGLPEGEEEEIFPFAKEIAVERKRARARRRSRFSTRLKSRAFDFFSIAAFCLFCLWLASRLMEVPLIKLISASAFPVLFFYLVLLLLYFAFFVLFLGETLGDRIFHQE